MFALCTLYRQPAIIYTLLMKTFIMDWLWDRNTNEDRKILPSGNSRDINEIMKRVDAQIGRAVRRLAER